MGRTYSTEDTNLKFLRSLPKEWKPMTVSLRHFHEFKDYTIDKLYGVLRTYELEIQQDEEIEKARERTSQLLLLHKMKKSAEQILIEPFFQNKCMKKRKNQARES